MSDNPIWAICPNCDGMLEITKGEPDEIEDWGEYAAECITCDSKFKKLEKQLDGSWKAANGKRVLSDNSPRYRGG